MRGSVVLTLLGFWLSVGASTAAADDITGADHLLCSAMIGTQCLADDTCATGPLGNWHIPPFVEVDLSGKRLNTTAASGLGRSTPIATLMQTDQYLVIQAYEGGRAFTMMVAQDTGLASVAIVLEGQVVTIFGACTPHEPVR